MNAHDQATHEWIEPLKELIVAAVDAEIPTLAICLALIPKRSMAL